MAANKKPSKAKNSVDLIQPVMHGELMDRVVSILDQARANVVRVVNSNMTIAYWLIGREIIHAVQAGEERADYGKQILQDLSIQLTQRYGRGFSVTNIRYFRLFYQAYSHRSPTIHHKACDELEPFEETELQGFSDQLSWSHYRTLCGVENASERLFYEIEAERGHWSQPVLERHIHSHLFLRLLKSREKAGLLKLTTEGQVLNRPLDAIKHPYVLDFLELPEVEQMHESDLEAAILEKPQPFLLELGKGFAFVARQLRIATEHQPRIKKVA